MMPNNLFFTYELSPQRESKAALDQAIQNLGNATPLTDSSWYVNSPLKANDAIKRLSGLLTDEDSLVIADTTNDESAWFNLPDIKARRVNQNWRM
jgi:hypothetical protein